MAVKLNDKQKIGAVAGVCALAVGSMGFLLYTSFGKRSELLAQMEALQKRESVAQGRIKQIPGLLEEKANLAATVAQYAEILPADQHVQHEAFVDTIDSYRRDTKIIIQKADYIKPREITQKKDKPKREESFIRHRYRFSLVGTVPDFIDFVNKIENHTRFLKVDAFSIKPFVDRSTEVAREEQDNSPEAAELRAASEKVKQIELSISTYTYTGAKDNKKQS